MPKKVDRSTADDVRNHIRQSEGMPTLSAREVKLLLDDMRNSLQQGEVIEKMPDAYCKVRLADGAVLLCYLHWRARGFPSKEIMPEVGSLVLVEQVPYDPTRGRINLHEMEWAYRAEKRRLKKLEKQKN